jgi:hypothetical protein
MTKSEIEAMSGIDLLRLIVGNLDRCREDFMHPAPPRKPFTPEQLIQIGRMRLLSEWDIYPDEWTPRQVKEALAGKPPRWKDTKNGERPVYDPGASAS